MHARLAVLRYVGFFCCRECIGKHINGDCDGNFNYNATEPNINKSCPDTFYGEKAKAYIMVYYECGTGKKEQVDSS